MNQFSTLPQDTLFTPKHGGALRAAAAHFNIPPDQWLDLSTGINPRHYPIPQIPSEYFTRLPEPNLELDEAINDYYKQKEFVSAAGSQTIIQQLPNLFISLCRSNTSLKSLQVGICTPTYSEHIDTWRNRLNIPVDINLINSSPILIESDQISKLDVLIVVNPCNPTGVKLKPKQLLELRDDLRKNGGWLVVDEAFIDTSPNDSLLQFDDLAHLLVLRSIGKFFGIPGIRAGFAFGDKKALDLLGHQLGPWSLSGPAQYICQQALVDTQWQQKQIEAIKKNQQKLVDLLGRYLDSDCNIHSDCPLFVTLSDKVTGCCRKLYEHACQQGILLRFFPDYKLLRIGHPVILSSLTQRETDNESQVSEDLAWNRLDEMLLSFVKTL